MVATFGTTFFLTVLIWAFAIVLECGYSSASGKTVSSTCPGFNRDVQMPYILALKPGDPVVCWP